MKKLLEFIDSPLGALLLAYILPALLAAIVNPKEGTKLHQIFRGMLAWGFDARKFISALQALVLAKKPRPLPPPIGPSVEEKIPVEIRLGIHDDEDPPIDGGIGRGAK